MNNAQQPNGHWVSCDSRNALFAQLPPNACQLVVTDSANRWGYLIFDSAIIIPVGYADMGLIPFAVRFCNKVFVGIDELLVGYEWSSRSILFKYKMPTIFHEIVRFDVDEMIVRDEIGFVGISYVGIERWSFSIDAIANYEIAESLIFGRTEEGESFKFIIPSQNSYPTGRLLEAMKDGA